MQIDYHDKVPPSPSPSGACSPNPVAPGTYAGTVTNASTEVIDLGASGGVNDHSDGAGTATIVIAADGSASGTWDMVEQDVFDETAKVDGVTGLADHRESTYTFGGGTVTGTACNLGLAFGTIVVTSCVDSLKGDCTGDPTQFGSSPAPTGLGPPASVNGGHVTWAFHYVEDGDAKVTDDLTVSVSSATP